MKPHRIFLIRHGESEANVDVSVHETKPDHQMDLTDLGVSQAEAAGSKLSALLSGEPLAAYISPFRRTSRLLKKSEIG